MSALCVVGQTFTFTMRLEDQANAGKWKAAPTIAAGDFKISVNGGAYENLDNLPTVTPAAGVRVQVVLSSAETTAAGVDGLIDIDAIDAAGSEWFDKSAQVRVSARDTDSLAYPNVSGRGMDVDVAGGVEVGAFQADTITADALATSAVAEIVAAVWSYATRTLTQAAAAIASAMTGSLLTIQRGDTLTAANITGLGDISGRSKLWFTVKALKADTDVQSIVQIEETAGLVYLNGADASARSSNGAITVTDEVAGDITITLDEVETDDLAPASNLYYDVQVLTSAGAVLTLTEYKAKVVADVTRAVA